MALLEVVRTEWSTSASSWEQGRSTPAVAVDSEGLKDGRHQCFEVGAWICFSDVYVGSLYGDSPVAGRRSPVAGRRSPVAGRRYAASPVYQSVVLNVGIWYGDSPVAGRRSPVRRFDGVPICRVERWNLIRRRMVIDSPVYADSPVCRSVGWTLESDTPIYGNRFACVRRFAGVPICCVERWNLIRRLMVIDSPVYADSPVCQSVSWTLESDTPNDGNRFACVRRFAGVLICWVGRWNLIRRMMVIDSPVYADSPVYQSVVLNVGIWYADSW